MYKYYISIFIVAMLTTSCGKQSTLEQPNIIFLIVDQLSQVALEDTAWVKTPNIDRLKERGTTFSASYVNFPLCSAQRAVWMTGQLPNESFYSPMSYTSIGTLIKEAGYKTAYFGKWHVGKLPEPSSDKKVKQWSGFDTFFNNNRDVDTEEETIKFLKSKNIEKPFFMVSSFQNPHDCCELARKIGGWNKRVGFEKGGIIPNIASDKLPNLPQNFRRTNIEPEVMQQMTPPDNNNQLSIRPTGSWSELEWKKYRHGYAQLVATVDNRIGNIIDEIESNPKLENTIVIFTSDHGDGLGAHQWNQKHALYNEMVNVPLIIYSPKNKTSKLVSSIVDGGQDVVATLLDYANIDYSFVTQGESLLNAESHSLEKHNKFAYYEFWRDAQELGTSSSMSPDIISHFKKYPKAMAYGIQNDSFKYIYYTCGEHNEMLFDLSIDSGELTNIAYDSCYHNLKEYLKAKLIDYYNLNIEE